jgi:YegS/Rv2252/BmrU family lipid kinase
MRAELIVNPVSGRLGGQRRRTAAAMALAARTSAALGADVPIRLTTRPGHATEFAAQAVRDGIDRLIVWGGDGTINEVAAALSGTGVALAIVPSGSGNGLARELRVSLEPSRALRLALTGRARAVDVADLDGRAFLNVAGTGFDACVAHAFDVARKGRLGLVTYARITIRELRRYVPQPCRVVVGGEVIDRRPLLIALANSAQYGNGARIAPRAIMDDGQLDVVVIEAVSPVRDVLRARRLFTGTIERDPGATLRRAAVVRLESDAPRLAHVDGQPLQIGRVALATVRPRALMVVAN